MVTAAIAVAVGVRADIWIKFVPRRNLVVAAPHQANGEMASEPHDSAVHTLSKPSCSMVINVSGTLAGISRPQ